MILLDIHDSHNFFLHQSCHVLPGFARFLSLLMCVFVFSQKSHATLVQDRGRRLAHIYDLGGDEALLQTGNCHVCSLQDIS